MPPFSMDQVRLRHIRFAERLIALDNATVAYMEVYGTQDAKVAAACGRRLARRPEIVAMINEAKQEAVTKLGITAERVVEELARLALFDPADIFTEGGSLKPLSEIPEDARRAIVSIDPPTEHAGPKAKIDGKRGSLQLLGETMALFKKNQLLDADVNGAMSVNVKSVDLTERLKNITGDGGIDESLFD